METVGHGSKCPSNITRTLLWNYGIVIGIVEIPWKGEK